MKKIILTLAAVSALTATAASAQPRYERNEDRDFGRPPITAPGAGIDAHQAMLALRIDRGVRNGSITRREAVRLNAELRDIERAEWTFRRSRPGLTGREIAQLEFRLDRLAALVRIDRNDRDYRQYGEGYGRR